MITKALNQLHKMQKKEKRNAMQYCKIQQES